jgi:hypothetical protein
MAEAVMGAGVKGDAARRFYVWMAAACLAVAVMGFMPTYFLPMAQGRLKVEPLVHLHGIILFSWVAFFCVQTWLVAEGRVLAHRTWGMLGVAIATAINFVVVSIVALRVTQAALPGQPANLSHDVRAFAWISIGGLLFFTPAFIAAIANIRRPEAHKRLMLLGTIALLPAPIARWFLVLLAPPPNPNAPPYPAGLPQITPPPVVVTIGPALVADLLLLVAIAYDWRTRGRPHPVYLVGGAILLALQLTVVPVSESAVWQATAAAIGHIAG